MCLISIIIPTYNSSATISSALNSIVNQSFTNFEILVIDGLSKDNTPKIVSAYNDQRLKVFIEKDEGIYDAMNKGIAKAKGDWILFLGSDDTLIDNALNKFNSIKDKNEFDVIYGNVYRGNTKILFDGEFTKEKILRYNMCHQGIFLRKKVFEIIGIYNIKYFVHADWDHNLRWFFSKYIKHKFENIAVARYGDGGFSVQNNDNYANIVYWNYLKYSKSSLNSFQKVIGLSRELFYSLRYRRFKDFKNVFLESAYLFSK